MSTEEKHEKLIDKVRKLMAKAGGTDNQTEADVFMAKANALLLKHNLTMTHIDTDDKASIIEGTDIEFGVIKGEGSWETYLMASISIHNLCESILHPKFTKVNGKDKRLKGGSMTIIGSKENIEVTTYMYEIATETIRRLSKKGYSAHRKHILAEYDGVHTEKELLQFDFLSYRMPWIRSYLKGAVAGLHRKLEEMKEELFKEEEEVEDFVQTDPDVENEEEGTETGLILIGTTSQRYGLMITQNTEAIGEFKKKRYKNLRDSKGGSAIAGDTSAFQTGHRDGKNISFNKGVESGEESKKIA